MSIPCVIFWFCSVLAAWVQQGEGAAWYMMQLFILEKPMVPHWSIFPQQGFFSSFSDPFHSLTSFILLFTQTILYAVNMALV